MKATALLLGVGISVTALAAPLATVNNEPITKKELMEEFKHRHGGHEKFLAGEVEIRKALNAAIDRRLFLQEARRLGLEEVPEIAGPWKNLEITKMVEHLKKVEIEEKSKITDAEVKAFYDTKTDELFKVRQISAKTLEEAQAIAASVKAGQDFEKLAREKSIAASKMYGGLLANLGWGSMNAEWEEIVFKLNKGQVSGPVASKEGFDIVRMEERTKVAKPELEKAKTRIRMILEGRKTEARRRAFDDEIWKKYAVKLPTVNWKLDDLKQAMTSKPTAEVASWKGGKMSLFEFASRLNLEMVAKLPANHHREQLDNLRTELVRQELFKAESRARGYEKIPEVAGPVKQLRDDMVENKLFDEFVLKDVPITDPEVKQYYEEHTRDFLAPERRHVAQIVVATEEKAKEIQKKLSTGAKFEALAKSVSTDPASSKNGGDLGWITDRDTPPEFDQVKSLKKGEVSAPVKTKFGYHLIKLTEIAEPQTPPFETIKDEVKKLAHRRKMEAKRDIWVHKLRNASTITVNDTEVKALAKEASL